MVSATRSGAQRVRLVQVLSRHQLMIQAYARAITNDFQLAEDVYQEVAIIVAEQAERIPQIEDEVGRWLREITRRKALELRRKSRRTQLLADDVLELIAEAFAPVGDALAERREAMTHCVAALSGDVRAIVDGRYRDDLSCEAIAERMGRSVQAVYAVLKRARLSLQECVERQLTQRGI